MKVNMNNAINFGRTMLGKVRYSMKGSRTGTDGTADCSGFVFACLRSAGGGTYPIVPSTETLHDYLLKNGFKLIAENRNFTMKRGQVIIWGRKGQSAGSAGHTGIAIDGQNWIECTGWKDTVILSNHDARLAMNGYPYWYVYEQTESMPAHVSNPVSSSAKEWEEYGRFTLKDNGVALRRQPVTSAPLVARLNKGQSVIYDRVKKFPNNYIWVRQAKTGHWIATGKTDAKNNRVDYWGTFGKVY
ncbi:peptidoglycan amidohydrolase family protein [Herbiconiux daphne]|uniref:Bacteriophage lysin domain-containing protein n=1 Tax=Herbiconiux daphne TaxID=2970914 RepID=A0ABT2H9J7_9MICO|nr:peptidoglycan amidohydrolase family protein [Herbiconiux daphne]MCS5736620.1 hypothetical protein [Herbiconiux daphne]